MRIKKTSLKYLEKHQDEYANFSYRNSEMEGTYSEAGIEVEHAERYGEICNLEGKLEYIIEQIEQLMKIDNSPMSKIILGCFEHEYEIYKKKLDWFRKEYELET